ncbi:hypothetical protein MUP01_02000 [Candidatus Bathyarchaeota archaeon]|nr:hypothetical protein [Candidatus Bathyarchaeota archaeon]
MIKKTLLYLITSIAVVTLLATVLFYYYSSVPGEPRAAIIDQLSSSRLSNSSRYVNQTFIDDTKALLSMRFSKADYYSDNATVENYKTLSSMGYKLIIWRAHSALDESKYVAISTSERDGSRNYDQYSNDQLKLCNITGDPILYFAITPKFVTECMTGRFDDTVIILMSCNGLKENYYGTAEAFVEKGAKVFISWDGWVNESDNDGATTLLLQHLINENNTVGEAINKIPQYVSEWGPSKLDFYPKTVSETAEYRIPSYRGSTNGTKAEAAAITILEKRFQKTLS